MTRARRLAPRASALLLALTASASAPSARAQGAGEDGTKQACVAAYDETQTSRQKGALRSARDQALACSQEACPAIVKKDCAQWLAEIDASLPTVSFAVKDAAGRDTSEARVFVDGQLLTEKVSSAAVAVDPGERTFRVEIEGQPPQEQKVILREGQKGRVVEVSFASAAPPPAGAEPFRPSTDGADIPVASFILGGVGVVGIGLFATFGAIGLAEKSDAEDPATGCAPGCSDDEVSSIETKFLVADVSLGVGLAALGAAVVVALVSGGEEEATASVPEPSVSVGAAPAPGGGFASFAGTF